MARDVRGAITCRGQRVSEGEEAVRRTFETLHRFPGIPFAAVLLFAFASPGCHATGAPMDVIFHVNSARVPCVGVAPMNCLQVKRGAEPTGDWQHFYSQIDGFDYEPGYLYRLLVR